MDLSPWELRTLSSLVRHMAYCCEQQIEGKTYTTKTEHLAILETQLKYEELNEKIMRELIGELAE